MPDQADDDEPSLPPGRYELLVTDRIARSAKAMGSRAASRKLSKDETPGTWQLRYGLPADFLREARAVA